MIDAIICLASIVIVVFFIYLIYYINFRSKFVRSKINVNLDLDEISSFKKIFSELTSYNDSNEIKRLKKMLWFIYIKYIIIFAVITVTFVEFFINFQFFKQFKYSGTIALFILILYGVSTVLFYIEMKKQNNYRAKIITKVLYLIDDKFKYNNSQEYISEREYRNINFDNKWNQYNIEHSMCYEIDDVIIYKLQNIKVLHDNSHMDHYEEHTMFNGILAKISFENRFNGNEDIYIKFLNKNNLSAVDEVLTTDNADLNNMFNIYTNNENLYRTISNSRILSICVDNFKKFNLQFELILKGNGLYIRFFNR